MELFLSALAQPDFCFGWDTTPLPSPLSSFLPSLPLSFSLFLPYICIIITSFLSIWVAYRLLLNPARGMREAGSVVCFLSGARHPQFLLHFEVKMHRSSILYWIFFCPESGCRDRIGLVVLRRSFCFSPISLMCKMCRAINVRALRCYDDYGSIFSGFSVGAQAHWAPPDGCATVCQH